MQKLLNKITASLATIILVATSFIPALVYAEGSISQDAKTTEENVEFNASINNEYNATLNVDEGGNLVLNLKVSGTGYLKDSKVTVKDNNYEIIDDKNVNIKSINGNVIELEEVNAGEVLNVSLPIKLKKEEKVNADILGKDSTVTLNATYINKDGKERKIEKTLKEHIEWTSELKEVVNQSLIRYIKCDDNKTMISFKIEEGIENNKMPVTSKEILVNVPSLDDNKPETVIVTGKDISYSYENDILTIKKDKQDSDGKILWDSQDEYIVTYIYDGQVEGETIQSNVVAKALVKGNSIEGKTESSNYQLKEQVGTYVESETSMTNEINKGYMYTNLKSSDNAFETPYNVTYRANVGYKELTDSIKIVENNTLFNGIDANNSILTKKVKVNKDNLVEILGEEGTIKVLSQDKTELGVLSKDKLELEVNTPKVTLETSKVVKEGTLEVEVSKIITAHTYTLEQVSSLTELKESAMLEGYKDNKLNSSKEITSVSKFTEPTSNASLDVNVKNLSTVVKNENVVITVTLKTKNIEDALYSNSKINIVLPQEVKNINVKEASLIYDDELKLNNLSAEGNVISLSLDGTQTKYGTQATSEGTVLRLVTDLTLDNLAPTSEKEVTLVYTNEATGEQKSVTDKIGIVAPTGFVTTNSLEVDGTKVTSQESNEGVAKVEAGQEEKEVKLSGTVVNNLGYDAEGLTILGTIPTSGNKDENEKDLGSTFDTTMTGELGVEGDNVQTYYSEKVNENVDGDSWTDTYTPNAKSYKLVFSGEVPHGSVIDFDYMAKIPANLGNGQKSKSTYAVYYDNNAEQGNTQNVVLAKPVAISTNEIPAISVKTVLTDSNTKGNIGNGSDIKEGKIFTYRAVVTNTGKETAKNVKVNINLPDGISLVEKTSDMTDMLVNQYDYETKQLEKTIDTLDVGKEATIEYELVVTRNITNNEEKVEQKIVSTVTADKIESISNEFKLNVVKGDIVGTVISNKTNANLKTDDIINYYLEIKNANFEKKNNIVATMIIPKELSIASVSNNNGTEYSFDEKSRTFTYKNPSLKGGATDGLIIALKVEDIKENKQVGISTKIKCDESQEESLETLNYNLIKDIISVNLSSNIEQNNISDTDELEYYINVKNNSSKAETVSVSDTIPDSLRVVGYIVEDKNGSKEYDMNSRNILTSLELNPNSTSRLTIKTKPYLLEKGRVSKIENKATISISDTNINTNTLTHTIVGTSEKSSGLSTEPKAGEEGTGNESFDDEKIEQGTYKISGQVWIDENIDGRKDENEQKIASLIVKLFDKKTGKLALDINGKELQRTTDESGKYTFVNIIPGEYTVVVEYDSASYGLASYRVEGLLDSENSDFVSAKIDDKTVAATDTIKVADSNIYNIDLGLTNGKIFDLDISKVITRVTVTNTKEKTKVYNYDNKSVAKVELGTAKVDFATVLVEYKIKVTNNGSIPGYAKSIVDYIPEGMTFSSELNNTWYLGKDGNAYNTNLANTMINPGETKELTLVLSRKMSGENTGTVRNTAEILTSYNEYGLEDRDVQLDRSDKKTDDKSAADLVIGMATGREVASFTGITLGILSLIAIAVYEVKKRVINKMYNII